jgi:hypothetical protein
MGTRRPNLYAVEPGPPAASPSDASQIGNQLPWLYPPADFLSFDKFGAVALPAIAASATILSFTVPNGRNGRVTQLGIDFVANGGAAYVQGVVPAPLTFQIVHDAPAFPFPDYEGFLFSPGAVSAPTPINGLMLAEGQVINIKVMNNTIVVTTQFLSARLLGYWYSKNLEPKNMSYR